MWGVCEGEGEGAHEVTHEGRAKDVGAEAPLSCVSNSRPLPRMSNEGPAFRLPAPPPPPVSPPPFPPRHVYRPLCLRGLGFGDAGAEAAARGPLSCSRGSIRARHACALQHCCLFFV